MRRAALLVVVAAALVAACGSSDEPAQEALPAGFDPIACDGDIGVMAPYGGFGAGDTVQMNWARVSLDKFNQEHGTAFGFVPANVDSDPEDGLRQANRLAMNDAVIAVVGPKTSDRKSTRLNSSHMSESRMPSSA